MLNNDTIVRSHNTTWVDNLIDARVVEAFLTTILNSVYAPIGILNGLDIVNQTILNTAITTNITKVQGDITNNITAVNNSMRDYVDTHDSALTQNISTTNTSMKVYVDEQISGVSAPDLGALDIVNQTMFDNDTIVRSHNTSWVDSLIDARVIESFLTTILNTVYAPVGILNGLDIVNQTILNTAITTNITKVQGDITNNITAVNNSMRDYVDTHDSALTQNISTTNASMKVYVDEQVAGVSSPDLGALDIVNTTMLTTAMTNNVTDIKLGAYTLTNFTANYATFGAFSNTNYTNLGPYLLANFTANYYGQTDRFTNTNYTALGPYTFANFTANLAASGPFTNTNYTNLGPFTNTNFTALSLNHITNDSNARIGILNITTNITISNGSNSASKGGIWYNGSGICIGAC